MINPPVILNLESLSDRGPKKCGSNTDLTSTEKKPEKQAKIVEFTAASLKNTPKHVQEKGLVEKLSEPKK